MLQTHETTIRSPATGIRHRGDVGCPAAPSRDAVLDAVIVGGGPAGLSAALVLGRARQDVLVLDAGRPANRFARSIGGLLGHDRSPASLRRAGRRQLRKLPSVEVVEAEALDIERDGAGAALTVACPEGVTRVRVRAVLLAHGLRYDPPGIPGVATLWGRSVFHCVFCDGWEVADKPIALHARGPVPPGSRFSRARGARICCSAPTGLVASAPASASSSPPPASASARR
jgi:alkyl hydroperoxide reductase subunit AhpF